MKRLFLLLAASVSFFNLAVADINLNVPLFSQNNPDWKNAQLGNSVWTIGSDGCAISSIAMLLKYYGIDTDPERFNKWLKNNGGYDSNGNVYWAKVDVYSGQVVKYENSVNTTVDQELQAGYPVIIQVTFISGNTTITHWPIVIGKVGNKFIVNDPWDNPATQKELSSDHYTSINYSVLRRFRGPVTKVLPGQLANGTIHQAILDCANLHAELGLKPNDNGGGLYVHDWYSTDGQALVTIQDFVDQYGRHHAIIYNPELGKAFLVSGYIRWYYMNLVGDGPKILGAPNNEPYQYEYYQFFQGQFQTNTAEYPKVNWERQDFATGISIITRLDMGTYERNSSDVGGGVIGIALVPGNGQTLNLLAYAKSADSIVVSGSWILGAVRYQVFREGQYAGDLDNNLNFVDSGLVSATAYRYYLQSY